MNSKLVNEFLTSCFQLDTLNFYIGIPNLVKSKWRINWPNKALLPTSAADLSSVPLSVDHLSLVESIHSLNSQSIGIGMQLVDRIGLRMHYTHISVRTRMGLRAICNAKLIYTSLLFWKFWNCVIKFN